MINKFVENFEKAREDVLNGFRAEHPGSYKAIVETVVRAINPESEDGLPDKDRIHEIDDGHYQGTLLFVVGEVRYQPSTYWGVSVGYGSCSGCDTLEAIREWGEGPPTEEQAQQYMHLAINVLQGFTRICGYGDV